MKKVITFILVALMLVCIIVPAAAEEPEATPTTETATVTEPAPTTEAPPVTDTEDEPAPAWTTAVGDWIAENAPQILSGGTIALSAVLLWLFKKGLLPAVVRSLTGIKGLMTDYAGKADGALSNIGKLSGELAERFNDLSAKLEAQVKQSAAAAEMANTVIRSQADMLYELMMRCNLPAGEKEKITVKYNEMVAALTVAEEK